MPAMNVYKKRYSRHGLCVSVEVTDHDEMMYAFSGAYLGRNVFENACADCLKERF